MVLCGSFSLRAERMRINFFEEEVILCYKQLPIIEGHELTDDLTGQFLARMEENDLSCLMDGIKQYQLQLRLNDWLTYLLIRQVGETILGPERTNEVTLFSWYVLANMGYKVQLNYTVSQFYLSVFSLDKVYNIPSKKHGDGYLVEISSFQNPKFLKALISQRSNYYLNINGSDFDFSMNELPLFKNPKIKSRVYSFEFQNETYDLTADIDMNMIYLMYKYPELKVAEHCKVSLSPSLYRSLILSLRNYTASMSEENALAFLLSFTQQAFKYKTDLDAYQINNLTFTAEEVLFYEYSDCEDRSVLLSILVKEVLNKETILIEFTDHTGVGVKLDKQIGKPISYNNVIYTYCEPTGPGAVLKPGELPLELRESTYTINAD